MPREKHPFSQKNFDFSLKAHEAVLPLYGDYFGNGCTVESLQGTLDDKKRGIDYKVTTEDGQTYTVSEKFRRPQYMRYGEVALRDFILSYGGLEADKKSEADILIFGYYDLHSDRLIRVLFFDFREIRLRFGELNVKRKIAKRQRNIFNLIKIAELKQKGFCLYEWTRKIGGVTFSPRGSQS